MAGMFYSMQEAAEKLGISEEELKQWAKDGKLRDFRDGQSVMFKVDEVEALIGDSDLDDLDMLALEPEGSSLEELPDLEPALDLEVAEDLESAADQSVESEVSDDLDLEEPLELALEDDAPAESEGDADLDDMLFTMDEDETSAEEPAAQADDFLLEPVEDEPELNLSDTQLIADDGDDLSFDQPGEDVSLAETGVENDTQTALTGMDTAVTGEGIDIFGGSEAEFKLSDDSMAETMAGLGASGEASSLEEIEGDVNLDSFGSGSGLLDLSLQADDTSLGGILDEIYTAEDEDGGAQEGTVEDMTEAADSMPMEELAMDVPVSMVAATTLEIPTDAQSNFFGGLLFYPLLLLLYTGIAALSGMLGGMNMLVDPLAGIIWYVVGGLVVLAIILVAIGFTRGGSPRVKAPKKAKVKREKAPKKPKKVKEKKPKRAKKSK